MGKIYKGGVQTKSKAPKLALFEIKLLDVSTIIKKNVIVVRKKNEKK
jgi:hypothetical protein